MQAAFQIASIIVSILLVILILFQVKGGGLGVCSAVKRAANRLAPGVA
jgi:preprotein translocase subunit SecG